MQSSRPQAEKSALPSGWQLPESIRIRVGREAGPQRAMLEDGHLLVILHLMPGPTDHKRSPVFFWRNPQAEWSSWGKQAGDFAPLLGLLTSYEEKLLMLEQAEAAAGTATEHHQLLDEVGPILRASRGLHRALQEARGFVKEDMELINARDRAAAIERNAELLHQDARNGLEFTIAKQAEAQAASARQMAATAHKLNLMAALFLPLSTVAGIFGMEIRSGLANSQENFFLIIGGALLLGILMTLFVRERKKKP